MITLRKSKSGTRNKTNKRFVLLAVAIVCLLAARSPKLQRVSIISASAKITKTKSDDHEKSSPLPTIVFVTASSQNHWEVAQKDILHSLQHRLFGQASNQYDRNFYFKANMSIHNLDVPFKVKMIFYDLDYEKKNMMEKARILDLDYPFVEYRRFDYSAYPPHVNISASANGAYAWKPVIVKQVLREQRQLSQRRSKHRSKSRAKPSVTLQSLVYWVDAGTVIVPSACHRLNRDIEFALEYGLFTPETSSLRVLTHPDTAFHKLIQLDPALFRNRSTLMCAANTILVDATNDAIWDNIIKIWFECAMDPNCIAPPGSSRTNHRYDQAVLSALMAKNGIPVPNRERRCIKRGTG